MSVLWAGNARGASCQRSLRLCTITTSWAQMVQIPQPKCKLSFCSGKHRTLIARDPLLTAGKRWLCSQSHRAEEELTQLLALLEVLHHPTQPGRPGAAPALPPPHPDPSARALPWGASAPGRPPGSLRRRPLPFCSWERGSRASRRGQGRGSCVETAVRKQQ